MTDNPDFAGDPDIRELVDRAALCERLRMMAEAHFTPLVEVLHAKTSLSRNALWRLVGDALAVFLDAGQRFDRLDDAKATAMAILKQPGSPLANRQMHYFDVNVRDETEPDAYPGLRGPSGRAAAAVATTRSRADICARPACCRTRSSATQRSKTSCAAGSAFGRWQEPALQIPSAAV